MLFSLVLTVLPAIFAMDPVTQDLVTPARQFGEACGFASCKALRENTLNVHIVPHTHGELGFTGDFYSHYTGDFGADQGKTNVNMKRILDYTITELWADSERKFTLSDMAYFFYWWKQRDGTVHRMVYELIRQGRLHIVGGGFSMSDEATTSYHAVIDMFTYSLGKLNSSFLECGRPLVSWQSDVFGHSREFASLMSQMGFSGHFINPISYDDEVGRMINKSLEFVWRGSDDLGAITDIFTHKLFDGYWSPPGFCFGTFCEDPLMVDSDSLFKNVEKRVQAFIETAGHRQAPYYSTKNIMVILGQRFGYFDAGVWFGNIDKLIRYVNEKSATTGYPLNLFYSSPACYLKSIVEANPELSTKQDDFLPFAYDQTSMAVGFYTARPTFKFFARQGHIYLQIAKQLQITAGLYSKKYESIMDKFKWINSIMQDHNIITGVLTEQSRLYYTHKMYLAIQASTKLNMDALNKLRKSPTDTKYMRCDFNISLCQRIDANQYYIVIYNPLSWGVTVRVRLPTANLEYIVYHPSGKRVKASLMRIPEPVLSIYRQRSHTQHELVFIAEDIPAMGFRSYFIRLKTFGWKRDRRAIVKKVNRKRKTKKYLVRQAYQNSIVSDESLEREGGSFDYDYFDSPTTPKTKIQFGSIENDDSFSDQPTDDVITPRTKVRNDDENPIFSKEKYIKETPLSDTAKNGTDNVSVKGVEKNSSVIGKNIVVNKNYTSKKNDNADNDIKVLRKYYKKVEDTKKPTEKVETEVVVEETTPNIFSEEDTKAEINFDNFKSENDDIARNEIDETQVSTQGSIKAEKIETTTSINIKPNRKTKVIPFSRIDEDIPWTMSKDTDNKIDSKKSNENTVIKPDKVETTTHFYLKDNNIIKIIPLKKVEEIPWTTGKDTENKMDSKKLNKNQENIKTKTNDIEATTNIYSKDDRIPFTSDDEVPWTYGKDYRNKIDAKKVNENKKESNDFIYEFKENSETTKPEVKNTIETTTKKRSLFEDVPSDLKDSDFSDMKPSSDSEGNVRNKSRKFNPEFGSDDELLKNQMFRTDDEKRDEKSDYGKWKDEKVLSDDEKWKVEKIGNDDENWKDQKIESDVKNKIETLRANEDNFNASRYNYLPLESTERERYIDSIWDGYDYFTPDEYFIRNRYVTINIDKKRRLSNITLSNGIVISFNAEMYFYASDDPKKFDKDDRQPGITMFRAMDPRPELINSEFKVAIYKNKMVQELHYEFSNYASFALRLYRRDPVIELEWLVGPVPIADDIGKEIFIRYTTDLLNDGTFYTDSNGRQTVKRIRNRRPTYEPMNPDYLAGNIYPVTSKIYIEDETKNIRFSVFNDRTQGGTSLSDGEIDLFLHRRILTDDTNRGMLTLNETERGEGIRVRGKHYIYLTKADYKPNRIFEKKLAKEIALAPQIFVTRAGPYGLNSRNIWRKHTNEFSALKSKLPVGVHVLTFEKWGENGDDLLLRLENYLEKTDTVKSGVKKVYLKDLFTNIRITSIAETTLGANMWLKQATMTKFRWSKKNRFVKNFNAAYGSSADQEFYKNEYEEVTDDADLEEAIVLVPQQIRTFFVTYEYVQV